jgi:hypothetical protein
MPQKKIKKKSKSEISRRLESLKTKNTKRLSSSGRGPKILQTNPKVGQKRKGVSDPRFSKLRSNKKTTISNVVRKAIDKDKESRLYKKRRDTRLKNAAAKKRKKKKKE